MARTNKKAMKNMRRQEEVLLDERSKLVDAALNDGHMTKTDISKASGLPMHIVTSTLSLNRELFAKYCVRRRTMVDMAADNVFKIVSNPDHPQCFAASKYVIQNFKSDLDDALEPSNAELGVVIGGENGGASGVTLKFQKVTKTTEEEEDEQ